MTNTDDLKKLVHCTPNSVLWVTDPVLGRTLVMVDQTGVGYFSLLERERASLVQPMIAGVLPAPALMPGALLESIPDTSKSDFISAWESLTDRDFDILTVCRGLYWAHENGGVFVDHELIARQALLETERVRAGREALRQQLGR